MTSAPESRIRLLFALLCLCALTLLVKLYFVQVMNGDAFADKADRQYTQPQGGLFSRGIIYFEDKNEELIAGATLGSGFLLAINPSQVEDPAALYAALDPYIEMEKSEFVQRASDATDPYEEVAKHLTQEQADAIGALELEGVRTYKERWRSYPGDMLAAHALGFAGYDGEKDTQVGLYGLEKYYERTLTRGAESLYTNFFAEIFSNAEDVVKAAHGEGEGDVVTSIEPVVQGTLEESLTTIEKTWNTNSVGGIIMDPMTGEIRALAARPTFDPNHFGDQESPAVFTDPIVENIYEMGSIVKPLTMAAGLDAGVISPETTYNDLGYVKSDGYTIYNYDKKGRGTVDMYRVLGNSLNTGVAFVTGKLGNERFARYMRGYGIDRETGIDLPGEVAGLANNLDSPRDLEHITASFGQGIALTPIEMTRALATLANGGMLVTPHVGKKIDYSTGFSKDIIHAPATQVLKESTSETITRMLVRVVDEYLAGGNVKLEHHSIAAKTGTAQIADSVNGGYYSDRYLHSFFGYFPAYDPKFIIFLYAVEPKGVNYASETLTVPFMDLAQFLINYYNLPPDR